MVGRLLVAAAVTATATVGQVATVEAGIRYRAVRPVAHASPVVTQMGGLAAGAAEATADFSWSPALPKVGDQVDFAGEVDGAASRWEWDFGDGGTSSGKTPFATHTFSEAGSYEVELTVTLGFSTIAAITKVVVVQNTGSLESLAAYAYVVPGSAHVGGLEGTSWVSDVVLYNPGAAAAQATLYFCPEGQDNTASPGRRVRVDAASSVKIEDFVESAFGESSASGSLVVTSESALVVSSRTYNDAANGTFGQYVAGQPMHASVRAGEAVRLIQLTHNAEYRTNIGFANVTGSQLKITVELHRDDGSVLGTKSYTVPPHGFLQATRIIEKVTSDAVADAYAVVSSGTPGAAYFVYASVIDNRTGDPVLILPVGRTSSGTKRAGRASAAALESATDHAECPQLAGYLDFGPQNHVVQDVAFRGVFAYVADSFGLTVYDVHLPETPQFVGQLLLNARGKRIFVASDLAFITDRGYKLHIISIADPRHPQVVSTVDLPGLSEDVVAAGNRAYVAARSAGLQLVDVTDPVHPALVSGVALQDRAFGVAVSGGRAYVATWEAGLQIIDVSEPAAPVVLGGVAVPGQAYQVSVAGSTAYVASRGGGLQVVDVTDPTNPTVRGALATEDRSDGVLANGTTVFLADGAAGVRVVDVASPATPVEIGRLETAAYAADLALAGSTLIVADTYLNGEAGLRIADVSDPAQPRLIGQVATPGWASWMAMSGATAFVGNGGRGVAVVDVSDADLPRLVALVDTAGDASGVAVDGDLAYVADGPAGLQILDVSDPASPTLLGGVVGTGYALSVALSGATAYLASGGAGLKVMDVSDPTDPRIVGGVDTPGWAYSVAAEGATVYVADYGGGLQIIDASDPTDPIIVASLDLPGLAFSVAVSGSLAAVAAYSDGLKLVDVSDPRSPRLIESVGIPGIAYSVAISGSAVFVAADWAGLVVVDVSDPAAPVLNAVVQSRQAAFGVAISPETSTVWLGNGPLLEGVILCGHVTVPVAAFEWAPGAPRAGEPVRFVDLSEGPPDSWRWEFGDGSSSSDERSPVHIFDSAGTYTVILTVTNDLGTSAVWHDVTVVSVGNETWVPASAALSGFGGTSWRSDLEIHNPGGSEATLTVALMERDKVNLSPRAQVLAVDPGNSTRLVDVLGSAFEFSGAAALRLTPTAGGIMATSRTYNDQPAGTYGQFIPGVPEGDAILLGEVATLLELAQSPQYRTNLGLVNVSSGPMTVDVELYEDDGSLLGTKSWSLKAYEFRQIDKVFTTVTAAQVAGGFLLVKTATGGGRFFAYASVVDNRTGDPVYIPAQRVR